MKEIITISREDPRVKKHFAMAQTLSEFRAHINLYAGHSRYDEHKALDLLLDMLQESIYLMIGDQVNLIGYEQDNSDKGDGR